MIKSWWKELFFAVLPPACQFTKNTKTHTPLKILTKKNDFVENKATKIDLCKNKKAFLKIVIWERSE